MLGHLRTVFVPIAREGWPFIAVFGLVTVLLYSVGQPLGLIGTLATAWCVYFFRDPDRVTPVRDGLVVAPADGVVQMIAHLAPPAALEMGSEPMVRVSIFMNALDCHVNRVPVDGRVEKLVYIPGQYIDASLDKASEQNERQLVRLELPDGRRIAFVQIAGLLARRIVCKLSEGQIVRTGERFGMIRFGSRLDVYLPPGVAPLVAIGQHTLAGETVIADLRSDEPSRLGEVR